jgi:trehalose/maltose transport system substrate-binding protein
MMLSTGTHHIRSWISAVLLAALAFASAACEGDKKPQPAAGGTTSAAAAKSAAPTASAKPAAQAQATAREPPPAVPNAAEAKKYTGAKISFYGDPVASDFDKTMAKKFTEDTGIEVNVIPRPKDATETFATYKRLFQGQSADIDVLMVDVIWPSSFADNLIDLGGKLIAMPWYTDFGMLYYRSDLLQKHGFSKAPETWDELEQMAKKIQEGEKAANPNFTGFVWQGKAYEGLTCDALEWIYSHGGGLILDGKKPALNNPQVIKALTRAKGWIGTISPAGVTSYEEEDARNVFQGGNAAFMRNWPYAYAAGNSADSAIKGKFDVAPLPHEKDQKGGGTIGGWQLGVSKFSKNQDAAIELVRYLTSPEGQKYRARFGSFIPTITSVQTDADVVKALPFMAKLAEASLIARPSNAAGERYNEVSIAFFQGVAQILQGEDPAKILGQVEQRMERALK